MPSRLTAALPVLYLLLVTVICYNGVLLPGRTFLTADIVLLTPPWQQHAMEIDPDFTAAARPATDPLYQFYPARKFLADSLHKGTVPLWNPNLFCGMPFAGDGQSAIFYPINWLYAVLPLALAFGWIAALHTFLAGWFFYLYGRRMGWGMTASLTGATVWMLCGVMVAWQMWQVVDDTLCWLPLGLYFWEGYRRGGGPRDLMGLAFAMALCLLAGHFQFAFYVWLTVFAYALFTLRSQSPAGPTPLRNFGALVCAKLLAVGLAAVQILASYDLLRQSPRTHEPLSSLMTTAMPWQELGITVIPNLFGGVKDALATPYVYQGNNYWELTTYFGVAALVFAVYGTRLRLRGHPSRFWVGLAIFALLMGVGSPLFTALYYAVPVFKAFHGLVRIFCLVDLAVAMLCALGVQRLVDEPDVIKKLKPAYVFGAILLVLLIAVRFAVTATPADTQYMLSHTFMANLYLPIQAGIAIALAGGACLIARFASGRWRALALALVALDMLIFAVGINVGASSDMLYPSEPDIVAARAAAGNGRVLCLGDGDPTHFFGHRMAPNTAESVGLQDVSGSDPLILKRYEDFLKAANREAKGNDWPDGADMATLVKPDALDAMDVDAVISPVPVSVPGFSLVSQDDVYVYRRGLPLPGDLPPMQPLTSDATGRACAETYTLDYSRFARRDVLLLSETPVVADPGWKVSNSNGLNAIGEDAWLYYRAFINGVGSKLYLEYLPTPILIGLYISLACLAVVASSITTTVLASRRTKQATK